MYLQLAEDRRAKIVDVALAGRRDLGFGDEATPTLGIVMGSPQSARGRRARREV